MIPVGRAVRTLVRDKLPTFLVRFISVQLVLTTDRLLEDLIFVWSTLIEKKKQNPPLLKTI